MAANDHVEIVADQGIAAKPDQPEKVGHVEDKPGALDR